MNYSSKTTIIATVLYSLFLSLAAQADSLTPAQAAAVAKANAALTIVRSESDKVVQLLQQTQSAHPEFKEPLGDCVEFFKDGKRSLVITVDELKMREATLDVREAIYNADSCQTGLNQEKVAIPALSSEFGHWYDLYRKAYSLVEKAEDMIHEV